MSLLTRPIPPPSLPRLSLPVTNYSRFVRHYLTHLPPRLTKPSLFHWLIPTFAFIWLLFLLYPHQVSFVPDITQVLSQPRQAIAYSRLASHLNTLGYPNLAIKELSHASRLNPPAKPVYDHQIKQLELLATAPTSIPREIKNLVLWPDTRDKYLALSLKFHQIGLDSLAHHYLSLATDLDPNHPEIMKLKVLLE